MAKVERLRNAFGKVLLDPSAYRCPAYNLSVSKTGLTGPHTTGLAIDFPVYGADAYRLLSTGIIVGFTGIGIKQKGPLNKRFIHFDDVPHSPAILRPRVWSY